MAFQYWLNDRLGSVGSIQFLAGSFLNFPQDLGWKYSENKSEFSNKFLHYLKFSPFSVPQHYAYHLIIGTDAALSTTVGFDQSFQSVRTFLNGVLPKIVKQ